MPQRPKHMDLALEIIKATFKVLLPDASTRVEGLADLVGLAFPNPERWALRNDFERQLGSAVDLITAKLARIAPPELYNTDPDQARIALEVVTSAVQYSPLTKGELKSSRRQIDRDALFRSLDGRCTRAWTTRNLSVETIRYGHILLSAACDYLIDLVRGLPEFNDDIAWQTYVETRALSDNIVSIVEGIILPRFRVGTSQEISEFEAKYATDITTNLGMMEVFGLDLPRELQRQPLSIAYITLSASVRERAAARFDVLLADLLAEVKAAATSLDAQARLDRSVALWRKGTRVTVDAAAGRIPSTSDSSGPMRNPLRIIIIGEAGSGKTTVARWLAVQIAAGKLPQRLSPLADDLPLYVPFRHVFNGANMNPREESLTDYVSSGRSASLPGEWLTKRLQSGRSLLIFDGLDELSDQKKSRALGWMEALIRDYPASDVVVTSRPDGYDPTWFDSKGFTTVHLQPMNFLDIQKCIIAWFEALRHGIPKRDWERYGRSMDALLSDVEHKPSIRDLAQSPLLCAMLCAFYSARIGAAPKSRGDLYRRVIEILVMRDTVKGSPDDTDGAVGERFELPHRLTLLQAIARSMVQAYANEIFVYRTEDVPFFTSDTVYQVIEERLARIPTAGVTTDQALQHLIKRSVVFRILAENLAQFTHRTFQEYLAAVDFVRSGDADQLMSHVREREWHQVFAFAASQASVDVASQLVEKILDSALQDNEEARDYLMLAAECLSASPSGGTEEVVARARSAIAPILPPRSDDEAVLVAGCGEGILPWLEYEESREVEISRHCIRAAGIIGGSNALHVIARYSQGPQSAELESAFIENWHRFSMEDYARNVLSNCSLHDTLRLSEATKLRAVALLPQVRDIRVDAREGLRDLRSWSSLTQLKMLDLGGLPSLFSLAGIANLTNLRYLNISDIPATEGFEEIGGLHLLSWVTMNRCTGFTDVSALGQLRNLRTLHMRGCINIQDYDWIGNLRKLWNLDISGTPINNLGFCGSLTELRRLNAKVANGISGALDLSKSIFLKELNLKFARSLHSWYLPASGALQKATVSGYVTDEDLRVLGRSMGLRSLVIESASEITSLEPLASLTSLEELVIKELPDAANTKFLQSLRKLRRLDLSNCQIRDIKFIEGMPCLERLVVDGCRELRDINALRSASAMRHMSLQGGVGYVDEILLSELAGQIGFTYDFEPHDPNEFISS